MHSPGNKTAWINSLLSAAVASLLGLILVHSVFKYGGNWGSVTEVHPTLEDILRGGEKCSVNISATGIRLPVRVNWTAVAVGELLDSAQEIYHTPTKYQGIKSRTQSHSKKWIVVTTVNPPTVAIQQLLKAAANGWQLIVVGDRKSPQNWSSPGAIYLDIKDQAGLGYETHSLIPYNSYARKNIGYLYAVQHGAETIYDTDDDNILLSIFTSSPELGFPTSPALQHALEYLPLRGRLCINPYIHFGQPSMWPRGYPLEFIADNFPEDTYLQAEASLKPLIQQGLANGDPDVDAIFRMTRATRGRKIQVEFDAGAPPVVLPRGAMAPFNSQNTLFIRDALWALLIPVTTSFRVCDIWRGYWAQRLLWDIGGQLLFVRPTVLQDRNTHSYFEDFKQELDLYNQAMRLIRFLILWQSDEPFFFDRALQLSNDMAKEGFWGAKDAELTAAWLKDLLRVGYQPPLTVKWSQKTPTNRSFVNFSPKNMRTAFLRRGIKRAGIDEDRG